MMPSSVLPIPLPISRQIAARGATPFVGGGWQKGGSSIDLDFANKRLFGSPAFSSALAITRASVGYAQRSDGVWESFASNTLRITDKGVLVEEARTNSIRNSAGTGVAGVAGSGGSLPTNWVVVGGNGLTRTYAFGTEFGMNYVEIRLNGTMADSKNTQIRFDASTQIAAVPGELWAGSVGLALVGGSLTNITKIEKSVFERNSGGTFTTATTLNVAPSLTSIPQRFSTVKTIGATGAYVQNEVGIFAANGTAIDITLRVYWPQLEKGAFATSPIPTTGSAATRSTDVITLNNPADYASLAQGSVYAEWNEPNGPSGIQKTICSMRVDGSNLIACNVVNLNKTQFFVNNAGVAQASLTSTNDVVANTTYKMASRWGTNDFAARISGLGAQPVNDNSGTPPSGAFVIWLGTSSTGAPLNGYIRRLALFKTPQTDAQLEAMAA